MALITAEDLVLLAGVEPGDETAARCDRAERLLASLLRRPGLELAERTETLSIHRDLTGQAAGLLFPRATPVVAVSTAGCSIRSTAVIACTTAPPGVQTVTYTGGWTAQSLPEDLRVALVNIVRELSGDNSGGGLAAPAGVRQVSLDGASVTFDTATAAGLVQRAVDPATIARWRRR